MENNGQRVYGFWDGDFTFHRVEYSDSGLDYTMRVRIDNESPEERARQNESNPNAAPRGWVRVRPATVVETEEWLKDFKPSYPLRPDGATVGLRHLRLHGPTLLEDLPVKVVVRLLQMTFKQVVVRDFKPENVRLVEIVDHKFQLTDDGLWLTSLMK